MGGVTKSKPRKPRAGKARVEGAAAAVEEPIAECEHDRASKCSKPRPGSRT